MFSRSIGQLEKDFNELYEKIVEYSLSYDEDSIEDYNYISDLWNRYAILQDTLEKKTGKSYYKTYDGVVTYIIPNKPVRHEIDNELLMDLTLPKKFYTEDEVQTLLKWTINNTRDNLSRDKGKDIKDMDLTGYCGYSQFSSLFPLEALGLNVTVNNIGSYCPTRHAFGTVTFPVMEAGEVVDKTYIVDATYSQFFKINRCVPDFSQRDVGFYLSQDPKTQMFAERLMRDGYVPFDEYIDMYIYGFNSGEAMEPFDHMRIFDEQVEYDYDEEEFLGYGDNLEIKPLDKQKQL